MRIGWRSWMLLGVLAFAAVTQTRTMFFVQSEERSVNEDREVSSKELPTPVYNRTFPILAPQVEPTVEVSEDTETCRAIRASIPQTRKGVSEKFGVPAELVQLARYDECDAPGRVAYGAFSMWSNDKEYTLRVPEGGEIVDYDEAPPKLHCFGEEVEAFIMLVRGISLACGTSK